jgi:hypothetical protein
MQIDLTAEIKRCRSLCEALVQHPEFPVDSGYDSITYLMHLHARPPSSHVDTAPLENFIKRDQRVYCTAKRVHSTV